MEIAVPVYGTENHIEQVKDRIERTLQLNFGEDVEVVQYQMFEQMDD